MHSSSSFRPRMTPNLQYWPYLHTNLGMKCSETQTRSKKVWLYTTQYNSRLIKVDRTQLAHLVNWIQRIDGGRQDTVLVYRVIGHTSPSRTVWYGRTCRVNDWYWWVFSTGDRQQWDAGWQRDSRVRWQERLVISLKVNTASVSICATILRLETRP